MKRSTVFVGTVGKSGRTMTTTNPRRRDIEETMNEQLNSVYVLIANEEERVKECIVVSDLESANEYRKNLIEIYGGANVCMASRFINNIPENIIRKMVREGAITDLDQPIGEKCYGCDQMKVYSGEFCDDCLEAVKYEGIDPPY
jgi:hypothetical protein